MIKQLARRAHNVHVRSRLRGIGFSNLAVRVKKHLRALVTAGGHQLLRAFAHGLNAEREFLRDFASTEDFYPATFFVGQTRGDEDGTRNVVAVIEPVVQEVNVDDRMAESFLMAEATFRQPHVQRHLTAFKPVTTAVPRPGFLAFVATAGGFTATGTVSTADAFTSFARALGGPQIVQFHNKNTFANRLENGGYVETAYGRNLFRGLQFFESVDRGPDHIGLIV